MIHLASLGSILTLSRSWIILGIRIIKKLVWGIQQATQSNPSLLKPALRQSDHRNWGLWIKSSRVLSHSVKASMWVYKPNDQTYLTTLEWFPSRKDRRQAKNFPTIIIRHTHTSELYREPQPFSTSFIKLLRSEIRMLMSEIVEQSSICNYAKLQ